MSHPVQHKTQCTLLLASNVALPQWLSVNCSEHILADVVCFKETTAKYFNKTNFKNNVLICEEGMIISNRSCLSFSYFDGNLSDVGQLMKRCKSKLQSLKLFDNLKWLNGVLMAVKEVLPPVLSQNVTSSQFTVFTYSYIWQRIFHRAMPLKQEQASGVFVCESAAQSTNIQIYKPIIFQCQNGETVSNIIGNNRNNSQSSCIIERQKIMKAKSSHNLLFFVNQHGQHESYKIVASVENCIHQNKLSQYGTNNSTITKTGNSSDHPLDFPSFFTKAHAGHNNSKICGKPDEILCVKGLSLCYKITAICVFRLNILGQIIPCRTGSHMEECRTIPCNAKFKCPSYYCIPHSYVCDGKWDCPNGNDEKVNCKSPSRCKHTYHCYQSTICIHLFDVCNKIRDCPYSEDELLCELVGTQCPQGCDCFHFAVLCLNQTLVQSDFVSVPYIAFHFSFCLMASLQWFDKYFDQIRVLNVPFNKLSGASVCDNLIFFHTITILNLSCNEIEIVTESCCSHLDIIKQIILKVNNVYLLQDEAFSHLKTISLIDLSDNKIQNLNNFMFINISSKFVLFLSGNYIKSVSGLFLIDMNLAYSFTENYVICCIVAKKAPCINYNTNKLMFLSCPKLLSHISLKIVAGINMCLLLIVGLFINIFSHKIRKQEKAKIAINPLESKGKKNFLFLVQSFAFCHIFILTYLTNIWVSDSVHEAIYFHLNNWVYSPLCLISFGIATCYFTMLVFCTSLIAFSRFSVVKYPYDTRFKSSSFVKKLFFVLVLLSVCFSLSAVLLNTPLNMFCFPLLLSSNIVSSSVLMSLLSFSQIMCIIGESILSHLLIQCLNDQLMPGVNNKVNTKGLILNLTFPILFHCVCWPITITIFFVSSFLTHISSAVFMWILVLVVPLTSFTSPLFYIWKDIKKSFSK